LFPSPAIFGWVFLNKLIIDNCCDIDMKKEKKKIAIYPGSFNPFTIGHLNVLEKVEKIFGKENVFVSVGINPEKLDSKILSVIEDYNPKARDIVFDRMKNAAINRLKAQIPSKNIDGYVGFLTNYVHQKEKEGYDVVIVRGIRSGYDLDSEYNQTRYMWDQKPDLKIIYIPCDPLFSHISSSAYRALESVEKGSGFMYIAREEDNDK